MLKKEKTIQIKTGVPIYLIPFADIHKGKFNSRFDLFKTKIRKYTSSNNCYFIGVGDIFDAISLEDARFTLSQLQGMHGKQFVDDYIMAYIEEFVKEWESLNIQQGQVLGVAEGNHEQTFAKKTGINPTKEFCKRIGVDYLAYSGYYTLHLVDEYKHANNVHIRYHHGYGGGTRTGGAPITKYEKDMMNSNAHIFIYGHDHVRDIKPYTYDLLSASGNFTHQIQRLLVLTGGWEDNRMITEYPSFSERKMYGPSNMGFIKIPIVVKSRRHGTDSANNRRVVEFPIFE